MNETVATMFLFAGNNGSVKSTIRNLIVDRLGVSVNIDPDALARKIDTKHPDRLSRKGSHQLLSVDELEKRRAELVFVNGEYLKTVERRMFFSICGAISEFERGKIKDRTSRGRRSEARQGKALKDDKDYGYKKDKEAGILKFTNIKGVFFNAKNTFS
jgi:hypothetical protein